MKKQKDWYLKIPSYILDIPDLAAGQKMPLVHIYRFGLKGCWQSNQTLAETFMVSPCTIPRWLRAIKKYIIVRNCKGYYRTIWAKAHPDGKHDKIGMDVRQKRDSNYDKNGVRPGANYHPTISNTVTENNKRTMASPSPLPAAEHAPATLRHRSRATAEQIARFKARFGRAAGLKLLTKEEF